MPRRPRAAPAALRTGEGEAEDAPGRAACRTCSPKAAEAAPAAAEVCASCVPPGVHDASLAPEWLRDNEYIHTGYRVRLSVGAALRSAFQLHNETMNIWTHLLGGLIVLFLTFSTLWSTSPHGWDRVVELRARLEPHLWNATAAAAGVSVAAAHAEAEAAAQARARPSPAAAAAAHPLLDEGDMYFAEQAHVHRHFPACANMDLYDELRLCPDQPSLYLRRAIFRDTHVVLGSILEELDTLVSSLGQGTQALQAASAERLERGVHSLRAAVADVCPTCVDSIGRAEEMMDELVVEVVSTAEALGSGGDRLQRRAAETFEALSKQLESMAHGFSLLRVFSPHEQKHGVLEYLEQWPLAVFMMSAVFCMLCSAAFHTLLAVSEKMAARMQRLDFAGICLLITGSTVPIIYYGFFCSSRTMLFYECVVSLVGVGGFGLCMSEWFGRPEQRVWRVGVFLTMACCGVFPLIHMLWHHGEVLDIFYSLLLMGALYLTGAVLYASRFPERCSPGSFDTCGASHQLFHVFVFCAVIALYYGLTEFYEWRLLHPCPAA